MTKSVFIAEKPSVARAFGAALKYNFSNKDGYMESEEAIVTWCVGHLVTMSYPEVYDEKYAKWSLDTIPFIPSEFKYEIIPQSAKQFRIVKGLLTRPDVDTIYICTDSGREGEYIYRLVDQEVGVTGKIKKRVWIDSQTEEEILRGIREAKDDSAYDNLGAAAYLRAKEDYLMGINFSRALTLRYGYSIRTFLNLDRCVVAVGRVMTCVLGIVVDREREIRNFVKTPFYRVMGEFIASDKKLSAEWRVTKNSRYFESFELYNEKGFKEKKSAEALIQSFGSLPAQAEILSLEKKKETKNAPLLYNLAELQNDCSRFFKIDPNQTLSIAQELYEKKLTTYPRTDARVLSTAIAKEINKNIQGLTGYETASVFARAILQHESYKGIEKTRYVNDKAITDHYAIIPTGQGLSALSSLSPTSRKVYEIIVRRFLAIFYPPAQYSKIRLEIGVPVSNGEKSFMESFFAGFKLLTAKGYLHVMDYSFFKKKDEADPKEGNEEDSPKDQDNEEEAADENLFEVLSKMKKGDKLALNSCEIKEGETSPPKRYSAGAMILTMENAGQFIEDEELRSQIKGSGIGTSATRAGILDKLFKNKYLALNKKTQIITPTQMGEMIYDTVAASMKPMLNPALTASWEKGLTQVEQGEISEDEYMVKLNDFITRRTEYVKQNDMRNQLQRVYGQTAQYYKSMPKSSAGKASTSKKKSSKKPSKTQ